MAMINVNGTSLYYEHTGGDGSPIVFSHGLLWNTGLFEPQVADDHVCGRWEATVEHRVTEAAASLPQPHVQMTFKLLTL